MFLISALRTLGYTALICASPKVKPSFCYLYLENHWVTLHSWVRHLKCSLCLLAVPKESLGYTALMGVRP